MLEVYSVHQNTSVSDMNLDLGISWHLMESHGISSLAEFGAGFGQKDAGHVRKYRCSLRSSRRSALQRLEPTSSAQLKVDEKPPPPPAGSAHDGWPEPAHYDKTGMERRGHGLWLFMVNNG